MICLSLKDSCLTETKKQNDPKRTNITEVMPPFFIFITLFLLRRDIPSAEVLKKLPEDQKHTVRQSGKRPAAEGGNEREICPNSP